MKKAIILEFVSIILLSIFQVFSEEVKPKIKLIYGKWGNKPGEFGFIPPKIGSTGDMDEPGQGPNDFYVDENDFVYILDNVNKRVQVFDKNGKFIRIDNVLYQEVVKMGMTRKAKTNKREEEIYTGLTFSKEEPMKKTYPEYWGCEVQKEKRDGKYIWTLILPTGCKVEFLSHIGIIGKDRVGNFYLIASIKETNLEKKFIVEIIKVSPNGELVGKIRIDRDPPDYYYSTPSIYLSPRGDIYIMNSDHSGFWIDCYPTELFDKPEGRDFTYLYPKKENQK